MVGEIGDFLWWLVVELNDIMNVAKWSIFDQTYRRLLRLHSCAKGYELWFGWTVTFLTLIRQPKVTMVSRARVIEMLMEVYLRTIIYTIFRVAETTMLLFLDIIDFDIEVNQVLSCFKCRRSFLLNWQTFVNVYQDVRLGIVDVRVVVLLFGVIVVFDRWRLMWRLHWHSFTLRWERIVMIVPKVFVLPILVLKQEKTSWSLKIGTQYGTYHWAGGATG